MMNMNPPLSRNDGGTQPQHVGIALLALCLLLLGVYTLWNFVRALEWAGIFAIALWPLYHRTSLRLGTGRHNLLLPLVFALGVALIFIVPVVLAGVQLARETHDIAEWVRSAQKDGIVEPEFLHHLPFAQAQVDSWWQANLADPGSAKDFVQHLTEGRMVDVSRSIGAQVLRRSTLFAFTVLTLFFLFRDGTILIRQMRGAAIRAFGHRGEQVGQQIIASIHGTVNGLVLVGLGEGLLLGIVYAIAGVPHPAALGALTAVAAMIPFGAPVIFLLAALLLAAQGSVVWAIIVACIGMAVTFTADHFVRPVLIGGATKLPFIWVLLGILGGVEAWGLLGLFIGPAIMAALILLWREWSCEQSTVM